MMIKILKKYKYQFFDLGLILILGLTPLFWYHDGYYIEGVDIDYPPYPLKTFIERTYVWSSVFLGGTDRSIETTSLIHIGLQALFNKLGISLPLGQIITFVFWYSITGFSIYYFISTLFKGNDNKSRIIRISAIIFYMFNFYQVYIWEECAPRVGEISGYIIAPILLGIYIKGLEKRRIDVNTVLIICVFSIISIGIGVQPPVIAVVLATLFAYFIFYLVTSGKWKNINEVLKCLRFSVLFILPFFLINAFWILPLTNFIIQSGYTHTEKSIDIFKGIELLKATSEHNTLLNVFRLYGNLFWFDGWGGELYHPWFQEYQNNPILILLSFLVPILAYSAILLSRERYVSFFTVITIIFIFLGKGIHPPMGNIFLEMYRNIPGFWIFRAPWQKFFVVGTLGYCYLASITCGEIYNRTHKYTFQYKLFFVRSFPILIIITILLLNITYNYAFILGKMLPSSEGDVGYSQKFDVGVYQKFPEYIFDAADWLNSKKEDFKIITLPDDKANVYDWGYGAARDITVDLFNKGIIFRQYGEGTAPPHPVENMYRIFINSLYNNLTQNSAKILGLLNVRYVLQRNDFRYNFYGDLDSPQFIKSQLSLQKDIQLEKSFGKWDFYKINHTLPRIYGTRNIIYINGDIDTLIPLTLFNDIPDKFVIFFSDDVQNNAILNISKSMSKEIIVVNSQNKSKNITFSVLDGWQYPIDWTTMLNESYKARSYIGSKGVISCNGKGDPDMLVFTSYKECPYTFLNPNVSDWGAYNSTLVYIRTGSDSIKLDKIYADGKPIGDIVGIWWETGWVGMGTKLLEYPVIIPANQRAIIQINHLVSKTVTLQVTPAKVKLLIYSLNGSGNYINVNGFSTLYDNNEPIMTFQKINPTKYKINVNSSKPFILVFSENYHPQWKVYIGNVNWFEFWNKPISDKNHFLANGYANAWYLEKVGDYEVTFYFWPQNLFYIGLIISGFTLLGCIGFLAFDQRRKILSIIKALFSSTMS